MCYIMPVSHHFPTNATSDLVESVLVFLTVVQRKKSVSFLEQLFAL
jgi:hypothetical protein